MAKAREEAFTALAREHIKLKAEMKRLRRELRQARKENARG